MFERIAVFESASKVLIAKEANKVNITTTSLEGDRGDDGDDV